MNYNNDYFKTWLNNLDNEKFYYIARNFLPETSTPFNQEIVSENLVSFFLNQEKAKVLLSTIDSVDSLLLGIFFITDGATTNQILNLIKPFETSIESENKEFFYYNYFENNNEIESFSYVSLIEHISNLSKRLIILSTEDKFILNPIFEDSLLEKASLSPILKNDIEYEENFNKNLLNSEFIRGYLSILKINPKLTDYQKRTNLAPLFPEYEVDEFVNETIKVDELLTELEIFKPFDTIEYEILQKLVELSTIDLSILFFARTIDSLFDNYLLTFKYAKQVILFLQKIKTFDRKTLEFILLTQAIQYGIDNTENFIDNLISLNIIIERNHIYQVNNFNKNNITAEPLIFDTDLTVKYIGKRGKGDILWRFASLSSLDIQTTYKLTKEDFRDALDSSMSKEEVVKYILENCSNISDCSALNYFDLIEKQYSQLSVYDGIILQTNQRISMIIDHHPEIKEYILNKLAEGVYLMSRENESVWTNLLEKAGLIIPRRKGDLIQSESFFTNEQWRMSNNYHLKDEQLDIFNYLDSCDNQFENLNKDFLFAPVSEREFNSRILRGKIELMDANKAEKQDLKNRLKNSMIVDESQLAPLVLETDISASGFEFRRKVNVCKMACKEDNTVLKVTYSTHELLLLVEKVKAENNNEFFVTAKKLPTLETITLPISKIYNAKIMNYVIK